MMGLRLAIRNIFRHRLRSLVSLSAIALGSLSLIFFNGFLEDTFNKMRESYIRTHTGHFQVAREGYFANKRKQDQTILMESPDQVIALLESIPGVIAATPRLHLNGMISTGRSSISFIGQGVDLANEPVQTPEEAVFRRKSKQTFWGPTLLSGQSIAPSDTQGIILGRGLAQALQAKVGDPLTMTVATVGGSINAGDVTIRGIFESSSKAFDDRTARLSIALTQELARTEAVELLVVMLKDTSETDRILKIAEDKFKEAGLPLEIRHWQEMNDFYIKTRELFNSMFLVLKMIIGIIVILSIYNTIVMSVAERTVEIGTIRALGLRRMDVVRMFLLEGLALGALGGLAGVAMGTLVTLVIGHIGITMPPPAGATMNWISEPVVSSGALVFSLLFSVFVALFSSLLPAVRASRLDIADALRHTA